MRAQGLSAFVLTMGLGKSEGFIPLGGQISSGQTLGQKGVPGSEPLCSEKTLTFKNNLKAKALRPTARIGTPLRDCRDEPDSSGRRHFLLAGAASVFLRPFKAMAQQLDTEGGIDRLLLPPVSSEDEFTFQQDLCWRPDGVLSNGVGAPQEQDVVSALFGAHQARVFQHDKPIQSLELSEDRYLLLTDNSPIVTRIDTRTGTSFTAEFASPIAHVSVDKASALTLVERAGQVSEKYALYRHGQLQSWPKTSEPCLGACMNRARGQLWLLTQKELMVVDMQSLEITEKMPLAVDFPQGASINVLCSKRLVSSDQGRTIGVGVSDHDFLMIDTVTGEASTLKTENPIQSALVDDEGNLLALASGQALYFSNQHAEPQSLGSTDIQGIDLSPSGRILTYQSSGQVDVIDPERLTLTHRVYVPFSPERDLFNLTKFDESNALASANFVSKSGQVVVTIRGSLAQFYELDEEALVSL